MVVRLKEVREAAGLTQEEVASALGVKIGTYRSWEQGRRSLNGQKLSMLADHFDVSADEIIGYIPKASDELKEKALDAAKRPDYDFNELCYIWANQLEKNERRLLLRIARAIADDE